MEKKYVLAIDIGASGGRGMLGILGGGTVEMVEIHRFSNEPVKVSGTIYWDVLRLFHEIKKCIIKTKAYGQIESIGIDTWGVDFALINTLGKVISNPVHYRDKRTTGILELSENIISKENLYRATGNQIMDINTAFQLIAMKMENSDDIRGDKKLLMMPDLLNYFICGCMCTEKSIASTTQLFGSKKMTWSYRTIDKLGLPKSMFMDIVNAGTIVGQSSEELCNELDIHVFNVVAVCEHDTQSALVAVPSQTKDFIFLSSGTWSLIGTELDKEIISKLSYEKNMSNEVGYNDKISFTKNLTGLWLIQEARRQWIREGVEYSYGKLEENAIKAKPFRCFIDTDDPRFLRSGDMPLRIARYCDETNQDIPLTTGEIIRCINESLAMKYRSAKEEIEACTGKKYNHIHIIGGGVQSKMLCQMTANATGCQVIAGPVEASALGNILVQFLAEGRIDSLTSARSIVEKSQQMNVYEPTANAEWSEQYKNYKAAVANI